MRDKLLPAAVFVFAVIVDQVSKIAVDTAFSRYDSLPLLGSYLRLYYIRNEGVAFGLRFGSPTFMLVVTVCVTLLLAWLFATGRLDDGTRTGRYALILVLAGAVGNLIDRVRLGEVIDFIDMGIGSYRWPTYNFADIYVTLGMIALIASQFFSASGHSEEAS